MKRYAIILFLLFLLPSPPVATWTGPGDTPTAHYLPAPGGHGVVIAVTSAAPEVVILQRRGDQEWVCEGGFVDYWYEGDQFFVLEIERDAIGVTASRRTEIPPPHFSIVFPLVAFG